MIEGFGSDVYLGFFVGIISFIFIFKLLHRIFGDRNRNVQLLDEVNEAEDDVRPPIYNPNCCPICLCVQSLALETNCGHLYCELTNNSLYNDIPKSPNVSSYLDVISDVASDIVKYISGFILKNMHSKSSARDVWKDCWIKLKKK